jgi:nicotinamide-nucleotide adenylyltransferase
MATEPLPILSRVPRIGMVARWKPVHLGHAAVLEALLERGEHVSIGIGSSNRYGLQNPFTAAESAEMIRLVLGDRQGYAIVEVPDLGHGPRWRAMVADLMGPLDLFVTANAYVRDLMREVYRVVHPVSLLPPERRIPLDGTRVRKAMARGEAWRDMVPPEVASYLERKGLVQRFRREFGLATLALDAPEPVDSGPRLP